MNDRSEGRPVRVAIVGGGCAGMTAAFELTRPEHAGAYQVSVYQLGWRLGGKGASGRGAAQRIEEHGLHLWMGFYENAFELMRRCYDELDRDPATCRIADWRQAFVPDPQCGVMERSREGSWLPWTAFFPPAEGLPGEPAESARRFTVLDYVKRCISLLRTVFEAIQLRGGLSSEPSAPRPANVRERTLETWLGYGQLATLGAWLEGLRWAELLLSRTGGGAEMAVALYEQMARAVQLQLERVIDKDPQLRRLWEIADLVLAVTRGVYRFRLITDSRGFDAIDDYDCREWLRMNGASERSLDSAFMRALYDLAFAYEDGDVSRPRIAAGQALRGAVRAFFTYRGAFFWKMQAGMGDVVFAPLYEVLKKRGVRFEFFHRLEHVRLGDDAQGRHVEALEFDVQARARSGDYHPLVDVNGLPCWPAEPLWDELEGGASLRASGASFESFWDRRRLERRVLRVGEDFDLVILAVGVGVLPHVCGDLIADNDKWRRMVECTKSVATQALQLWVSDDLEALGWHHGSINVSGFVEPFDTWADMTHLIAEENYPGDVGAIAYFCSVLPDAPEAALRDPSYPERRSEEVFESAVRFLENDLRHLWPRAIDSMGQFRWQLLVPPEADVGAAGASGSDRLRSQFWAANVNPSDRYSLSLPGTLRYRISPLERSYDNLTVAGDWTHTGFDEGCVEAAVMSGRLAAHAISKLPRLEDIVGYDHP